MIGREMELERRYRLMGEEEHGGIRTFRAFDLLSGRERHVFLLSAPGQAGDRELFAALRAVEAVDRRAVSDSGFEGSAPYLVTAIMPEAEIADPRDWLRALLDAAPPPDPAIRLRGSWKTGAALPRDLVEWLGGEVIQPEVS